MRLESTRQSVRQKCFELQRGSLRAHQFRHSCNPVPPPAARNAFRLDFRMIANNACCSSYRSKSVQWAARREFTIGQLSRRAGIGIETIRYYERIGLMPRPPRTGGGRRAFGPDDLAMLSFIKRCRELGFSLDDVRALLTLRAADRNCSDVKSIAVASPSGGACQTTHPVGDRGEPHRADRPLPGRRQPRMPGAGRAGHDVLCGNASAGLRVTPPRCHPPRCHPRACITDSLFKQPGSRLRSP